ncbi:AAA ATPase domain-containing protein [Klenkia terrae]|nr:AAA ATPase domain-containing protein [Klenkia terrae]
MRLQIRSWRQFSEIDLAFHPRLTVITGANASGKTTLLNILGRHFNWQSQLLGVPEGGGRQYWRSDGRAEERAGVRSVGTLWYELGGQTDLLLYPDPSSAEQTLNLNQQQAVPGLYISSHRSISRYQPLVNIPAQFSSADVVFEQFFAEILNRYSGAYTAKNPLTAMKEALIAAALFGRDSESVEANPEARDVWESFQEVLSLVLPGSFGFVRLVVRSPDIVVVTTNGEFLMDAVSGGISSIIELSWQLLLRSRAYRAFTVCMDEPENHLHPSLQRSLIPGLLSAFPTISFIIATHSPFIVTSVADSHVYVLEDVAGAGISSRLLDQANKSASADETLQRVLGMSTTIPMWVEGALAEAMAAFEIGGATAENLRSLQLAMRSVGLQDQFPAAVNSLSRAGDA